MDIGSELTRTVGWPALRETPVGPQLARMVTSRRLESLSPAELVDVAAAAKRLSTYAEALGLEAGDRLRRNLEADARRDDDIAELPQVWTLVRAGRLDVYQADDVVAHELEAALARTVVVRDRDCVGVGCAHPADSADLDHTHPHAAGGPTRESNLGAACRAHHPLKDGGGFTLAQDGPGTFRWTYPSGHTYTKQPLSYPAAAWQPVTHSGRGDRITESAKTVPASAADVAEGLALWTQSADVRPRPRTPSTTSAHCRPPTGWISWS